jgi:ABC-type microcin C transport system permease subunit YejB
MVPGWPYRFDFALAPEELQVRLAKLMAEERWSTLRSTIGPKRLRIWANMSVPFSNAWNPVFSGRVAAADAGCHVIGYFRPHIFTVLFIVAFLGMCVWNLVEVYALPHDNPDYLPDWRQKALSFQWQLLAAAIGINVIGWLVGIPHLRKVRNFLRELQRGP